MDFFLNLIQNALVRLHTAYIGKVIAVNGNTARVAPLTYSKDTQGNLLAQAPVTAVVPQNVKYTTKDITYLTSAVYGSYSVDTTSETTTVLVPDELKAGDIVLCVVCERDIAEAVKGNISEPSLRLHDMNNSVIVKVL